MILHCNNNDVTTCPNTYLNKIKLDRLTVCASVHLCIRSRLLIVFNSLDAINCPTEAMFYLTQIQLYMLNSASKNHREIVSEWFSSYVSTSHRHQSKFNIYFCDNPILCKKERRLSLWFCTRWGTLFYLLHGLKIIISTKHWHWTNMIVCA